MPHASAVPEGIGTGTTVLENAGSGAAKAVALPLASDSDARGSAIIDHPEPPSSVAGGYLFREHDFGSGPGQLLMALSPSGLLRERIEKGEPAHVFASYRRGCSPAMAMPPF